MDAMEPVTFEPEGGATYYDGRPHSLGGVHCTIADGRIIVEDVRGGVHQFLLPDLTEVSPRGGFMAPKEVRLATPGNAITFFCKSKDEMHGITNLIREAMRSSF